MANLYAAIGGDSEMDQDQLQRCYRAKARETHPDHGGDEAAFKAAAAAWAVLGDPAARARYDATGEVPGEEPPAFDWLGALNGVFGFGHAGVEPLARALAGIERGVAEANANAGDCANLIDLIRECGQVGVEAALQPAEDDDAETIHLRAGIVALGDWFRGGDGRSPLEPEPNRKQRRERGKERARR